MIKNVIPRPGILVEFNAADPMRMTIPADSPMDIEMLYIEHAAGGNVDIVYTYSLNSLKVPATVLSIEHSRVAATGLKILDRVQKKLPSHHTGFLTISLEATAAPGVTLPAGADDFMFLAKTTWVSRGGG